jgi:ABC-type uncharacterized transport system involved in gliding motility auxiliary subunit
MKGLVNKFVGAAGLLVFLGILIAINALVAGQRVRWDVTENRLYTLSDGMKHLLAGLNRDVTLKFYYSKSSPTAPVALKQYASRILDLLRECELASDGRIAVEVFDPQPDSDEEEWAQRYGLAGQPIGPLGAGGLAYLGIVAIAGTKEAAIPVIAPDVEPQLEYLIGQLISETTRDQKRKVGVMSPLPVLGDFGTPYAFRMGAEPWIVITELKKTFDVVQVDRSNEPVPDDIETLVVIHPRGFTLKDAFRLDQFVMRGGKLVIFQDPLCLTDADPSGQDLRAMVNARSELNRLTRDWGYEMDPVRAVADPKAATRVRFGTGIAERSMSWMTLRRENLDEQEIATASLDFMYVPFAGAFKGKAADGLTATTLIRSSEGAGTMGTFTAMSATPDLKDFAKEVETLPIALRLSGRFKSSFPEGMPLEPGETNMSASAWTNVLKESAKDTSVVLVGDVDMLSDRVAVERLPFGNVYQRTCDNIDFAVNVIGQLTGDDALITLRSRNTYRRPFERVDELELAAAMRGREEQMQLQSRLQELQDRLSQLEAAKDPQQRFVLSPEQQAEMEKFRKEQFETQRQLRILSRNLNREIEALGFRVKAFNMAMMPAFIAAFGMAVGLRRRIRATR